MTWKRATHYTWRAFLTFLAVSFPGLIIQIGITGLISAWQWQDSDSSITASTIGWITTARAIAALWVQLSILFVFFKYAPAAIVEVQENRRAATADLATAQTSSLEK